MWRDGADVMQVLSTCVNKFVDRETGDLIRLNGNSGNTLFIKVSSGKFLYVRTILHRSSPYSTLLYAMLMFKVFSICWVSTIEPQRIWSCLCLARYYMNGVCREGEKCQFSHDRKNAKPSMVRSTARPASELILTELIELGGYQSFLSTFQIKM